METPKLYILNQLFKALNVYFCFHVYLRFNIVYDIKNEDFGQRHFIVEGPNKILIDVIQPIPPSEEFLKNYL